MLPSTQHQPLYWRAAPTLSWRREEPAEPMGTGGALLPSSFQPATLHGLHRPPLDLTTTQGTANLRLKKRLKI